MCDCNKTTNISMGCCEPMLGPIENYYTKPATDRKIEEAISGISAVTIDEVQEMIDEAVSGITVSGVTEEELNEAIASAKTQIEGEIPSLDGYASEQWVEDKHYITGVDLSNYATTGNVANVSTALTAHTSDATVHVTSAEKSTWNSKPNVWCGSETDWSQISGGTLDPQCIYLVY